MTLNLPDVGHGQHRWALRLGILGLRSFMVWVLAGYVLVLVGVSPEILVFGGCIIFVVGALLMSVGSIIDGFQSMAPKSSLVGEDSSADDTYENHGSVGW